MSNYVLSCCSTVDRTVQQLTARDIQYTCFHYFLDGVQYPDDLGQTMPFDKFYEAMVNGADTRTSQINMDEYMEYFRPFLEAGKDVLHVSLSSGISGSYNSARNAAEALREEFPDRKLYIVDSLSASAGYGLLVDKMADLRDEGMDIDQLRDWAEEHKAYAQQWFFSTDLTFFIKGGRVSKAAGMFGTVLNICPLLNVSFEGKLVSRAKVRTKKKVIEAIAQKMFELAEGREAYNQKCFITHSACYEDAKAVADLVEAHFPHMNGKVEITDIGTTIGSHTGPGTVALFFWGDKREN